MSQNRVLLLGLDFGSTTCSALIVSAVMASNVVAASAQFNAPQIVYRTAPVFTPFNGENIDATQISQLIRTWLSESHVKTNELFAASAIITGLAAQKGNVETIRALIAAHIPNAAIIAADDPHLESWLAFMGSCAALSRYHASTPILNLDIGGGTTNAALGENGNVLSTGCHFIGARHVQFVPGGYQLSGVSSYGKALLDYFGIQKTIGDTLDKIEITQIMTFYVQALGAIAQNNHAFFAAPIAAMHLQAAWNMALSAPPKITFSGGVGELVYQIAAGKPVPSTTFYGDFGIDLAQAIVASPVLSANLKTHVPENLGRATVTGLALNSTEVSGSSIYLANPNILPLHEIPILAKLPFDAPITAWQQALTEASRRGKVLNNGGACLQITHQYLPSLQQIKALATMLSTEILSINMLKPLVLLIEGNFGKTLGNYITHWGKLSLALVVIDEVAMRDAHFVNLGKLQQGLVPVSFYGMY